MARFKSVLWEDPNTKLRVRAREITDGGSRDVIIDKNDKENWDAVIAEFPLEEIDKASQEDVEQHRVRKAKQEAEERDSMERRFQEELFNVKVEVFEIPEIKECTDKLMKRRIRKSKSFAELYVYAAAIVVADDLAKADVSG
tara:strand:+ start:744 stop:1169 length:426 start_codon:yes stop_codon:yes gene_type:complete